MISLEFDLLQELRNVCVKIPLFQAIQDSPIYAKTVRELCIRKPRRKLKDPPTIHVMGKLIDLRLGKTILPRYGDPNNLVVILLINNVSIPNTLVDQGATINTMTK